MQNIPVNFYMWENSLPNNNQFKNATQTIVVDPRNKSSEELAIFVKNEVSRLNPNKIALRFWKELTIGTIHAFDVSKPLDVVRLGGIREGIWQYWRDFFFYLEKQGVTPDILIHDMEEGYGYWNIPSASRESFFREIFNNMDQVGDYLPQDVASSTYDEFMGDVRLRISYHRHADRQMTKLMQKTFNGIIQYIYGKKITQSNYKDRNMTFDVLDEYGNYPHTSRSMTSTSSPVIYLDDRSIKTPGVAYTKMDKNPRWNRLIEKLNVIISCLQSGGNVIPWIAPPGYGRYGADTWANEEDLMNEIYIWHVLISILKSMGISEYIVWNPPTRWNPHAQYTDSFMDNFLSYNTVHPVDPQTLTRIEPDADLIKVGDMEVHYAFLKNIF